MDEPLMTAAEVATWLRIDAHEVYRRARRGEIPCVRLGRLVRFEPAAIRQLIADKRATPLTA